MLACLRFFLSELSSDLSGMADPPQIGVSPFFLCCGMSDIVFFFFVFASFFFFPSLSFGSKARIGRLQEGEREL